MMEALFDTAAASYDDTFTNSIIGKMQRERVYVWLQKVGFFNHNKSVFELNCGTGFDAQYFHSKGLTVKATDISGKMIEVCKKNRSAAISFSQLNFKNIESVELKEDAVFSNFGGLNCLSGTELENMLKTLSTKQKSGNMTALVIMPKFSMIESFYLFLKLKWKGIFRRNTNSSLTVNVDGIDVPTYFHSPRQLKKILKPNYHIKLVKPVALFLPPSYLEPMAKKHSKLMAFANTLESIFGKISLFSGLSDHFIIVAEKK